MDYHGCNDLADHLRYVSPSVNGDVPVVTHTAWCVEAVCKVTWCVLFCGFSIKKRKKHDHCYEEGDRVDPSRYQIHTINYRISLSYLYNPALHLQSICKDKSFLLSFSVWF